MIFLSHQAWSFLRPTLKRGSIVLICSLIITALIFPVTKIYAANDIKELSELLKSELGLEISEDKLSNLPFLKQAEMINLLSMIERGRTLFSGKTPAENALGVLAQLVEGEVDKGVWDTVLDSLLKLTQTPVEKAKDIADISTGVFLSAAAIKAMAAVPRERLVFDYIQNYRIKGKSDEDAWKEMVNKYNGISDLIGGCNLNALITGDGDCQRVVTLQRGGESLRSYAQLTYESFDLAQRLSSNPQQKETLKQWVLSEVEKAQNTKNEQPSFLSRIATVITTTIVKAADAIQTFVTNAAQTVTNSLKTASTGVKEFFTDIVSQKKDTTIQPSDLSGQISNTIPDKQVAEKAKKQQAEEEEKRLEAERQQQEDQRKIEEQRHAQAAAEEALKKAKTEAPQPNPTISEQDSRDAIAYLNTVRASSGKPPIIFDKRVFELAFARVKDQRENKYFDHTNPITGACPYNMKSQFGLGADEDVAENIADGYGGTDPTKDVIDGWMTSRGHRNNLLYSGHTAGAIACYQAMCVFLGLNHDKFGGSCYTKAEGMEFWKTAPLQPGEDGYVPPTIKITVSSSVEDSKTCYRVDTDLTQKCSYTTSYGIPVTFAWDVGNSWVVGFTATGDFELTLGGERFVGGKNDGLSVDFDEIYPAESQGQQTIIFNNTVPDNFHGAFFLYTFSSLDERTQMRNLYRNQEFMRWTGNQVMVDLQFK